MKVQLIAITTLCCLVAGCTEPTEELDRAAPSVVGTDQDMPQNIASSSEVAADNEAAVTTGTQTPVGKFTMPTEYNKLTREEEAVLLHKGTQRIGTGEYDDTMDAGIYVCRQCNSQLYRSDHKFDGHCGWPAFDDEISGAVTRVPDADGSRTEIVCANCDGHLGHIFKGERKTEKNIRHCVNSISMIFIPDGKDIPQVIVLKEDQ